MLEEECTLPNTCSIASYSACSTVEMKLYTESCLDIPVKLLNSIRNFVYLSQAVSETLHS